MMYTNDRFTQLVGEMNEICGGVLVQKEGQYTPSGDRLQNFRQIADFLGISMAEVCLTYMLKHVQSLVEFSRKESVPFVQYEGDGSEGIAQKIADLINYSYLLAAIFDEKDGPGD